MNTNKVIEVGTKVVAEHQMYNFTVEGVVVACTPESLMVQTETNEVVVSASQWNVEVL